MSTNWFSFFHVRKCASCGAILPLDTTEYALCGDCRRRWSEAQTENCSHCFSEAVVCTCMPKLLEKSGALCLRRAVFYHKARPSNVANRLIFRLKNHPSIRLERFLARELSALAREELACLEAEPSEVVVTYLPRRRVSRRRAGLDQAERMARALSEQMGVPMACALQRKGFGKLQKTQKASGRIRNTKGKFVLADAESVKGKTVLLYDDVVTTGASMAACVPLLQKAGAKAIVCLCLGQNQS